MTDQMGRRLRPTPTRAATVGWLVSARGGATQGPVGDLRN